jgi:pimeloyl-ACP methyl ester carboxylesterase
MFRVRSFVLALALLLVAAVVALAAWLYTPDRPRALLEAKYLAAPSDYLDVAGLRLHVRDSGPRGAPAVILLHGLGSSLHTWEPWAAVLSAKYRVIRYDLPGFGLTGADPTGDYTQARGMDVLEGLMDRLGIKSASLVGSSMGGRLAWNLAARSPARVDKLVLISPDGFASPGFDYDKAPAVPAVLKLMKHVLPRFMLRTNLVPAYADPARLTEATVTRYHDMLLAPGVRGAMLDRMGQTKLDPPEEMLRRITAPTLLLWGDNDAMIPVTNAADYLKVLPRAELVRLPALGHVPHEEAPERSVKPVLEFLAK